MTFTTPVYFSHRLPLLSSSLILSLMLSLCCLSFPSKATGSATEYQVKAAFLYNFINFIAWPDTAFSDQSSPYVICIMGEDPFGGLLEVTTANVTAKGRHLTVKRLSSRENPDVCHILFISTSEQQNLESLLPSLQQKSILTVSEIEDFVHEGGFIEFYTVRSKIRLKINRDALESAGLKADGTLLNLANICDRSGCQQ